jgi:hypothetical protein
MGNRKRIPVVFWATQAAYPSGMRLALAPLALAPLALALLACDPPQEAPDSSGSAGVPGGFSGAPSGGGAGEAGQGGGAGQAPLQEGGACESPGVLACPEAEGNFAGYSLRCSAGAWAVHETCAQGTYCNPVPGADLGRCMVPFEPCIKGGEDTRFCDDENHVVVCGPGPFVPKGKTLCGGSCSNTLGSCGQCKNGETAGCGSLQSRKCVDGKWQYQKC